MRSQAPGMAASTTMAVPGNPISIDKEEYMESTQNQKNLTVQKMKIHQNHRNTISIQATLYSISKENGYLRILPNISIKSWQ